MTSSKLLLTERQRQQIVDLAITGRPNEVCGLLAGHRRRGHGVVTAIVSLTNVASTPRIRYQADPKAFVAAYRGIERHGDDLIGIYHSHPMGKAIPSMADLAEATWPDLPYIIVGFSDGLPPDVKGWMLRNNTYTPVELVSVPDQDPGQAE